MKEKVELNKDLGDMLREALVTFTENIKALKEFYHALHPLVTEIDTRYENEVKEMFEQIVIERPRDSKKPIKVSIPNKAVYKKLLSLMKRGEFAKTRSFNTDLLYQSMIINLCTYIESLVLEIGRVYYKLKTDKMLGDTVLKFEDIKGLDADEIAETVIEKKVINLGYGSLVDWIKFFTETMKVNIQTLVDKYSVQLSEILQRRHLYIHNAGKINARYLENCDKRHLKKLGVSESKGTIIKTDKKYLYLCFLSVQVFGGVLGECVWYKFVKGKEAEKEREAREWYINNYGFDFIVEGEYQTAQEYFELVINNFDISETADFYMRANYWQSLKWQNKLPETEVIKIKNIDLRNKDYLTKLAVFCLLDEKQKFFETYPKAISAGEVNEECLEWPIFKEMRKDARFKGIFEEELKKRRGKKQKKNKQAKKSSKKDISKKSSSKKTASKKKS